MGLQRRRMWDEVAPSPLISALGWQSRDHRIKSSLGYLER